MKQTIKYILIITISILCYYCTDLLLNIINNNKIKEKILIDKVLIDKPCIEGYYYKNEVVLGKNGISVDVDRSFVNMKGYLYDKNLLEYKTEKCKINLETSLNTLIKKASDSINSISILINVSNIDNISIINNQLNEKFKLNYIIDDKIIDKHYEELILIDNNYVYSGNIESNINKYKKITNFPLCISLNKDNLLLCSNNKINTITNKPIIKNNMFNEIKGNLSYGEIYVIQDNKNNIKELNAIINFTKAKRINVVNIYELLN